MPKKPYVEKYRCLCDYCYIVRNVDDIDIGWPTEEEAQEHLESFKHD